MNRSSFFLCFFLSFSTFLRADDQPTHTQRNHDRSISRFTSGRPSGRGERGDHDWLGLRRFASELDSFRQEESKNGEGGKKRVLSIILVLGAGRKSVCRIPPGKKRKEENMGK